MPLPPCGGKGARQDDWSVALKMFLLYDFRYAYIIIIITVIIVVTTILSTACYYL